MADRFNFIYDGKHHPNYRVEYCTKKGTPSVSSPAIFKNDKEAIATALKEHHSWKEIGLNVIVVKKYTKEKLEEIFRKVA